MKELVEIIPVINFIIMIGGGVVLVMSINKNTKTVEDGMKELQKTKDNHEKRITVIETTCRLYGHDVARIQPEGD